MSCQEAWAEPSEYAEFWCTQISGCDEEATVKNYLRRASSNINMALQAQGACNCTLSDVSVAYLRDLAIVLAVVYHSCPCARPKLSDAQLALYSRQASDELSMIRKGEIELCEGQTGSDFPAIGWASQSWTSFNAAQLIVENL